MTKVDCFLSAARAQLMLPYVWPTEENKYSGKGLVGCVYPEGRDCSGLVSVSLSAAGDSIDRRPMWSAQKYSVELLHTTTPLEGDLVVYGRDSSHVTHIEIYCAPDLFLGAMGGGHLVTSPDIAQKVSANVRYRKSARTDVVAYLVNPLR